MHKDDRDLIAKYSIYRREALQDIQNIDGFLNIFVTNAGLYADKYFCNIKPSTKRMQQAYAGYILDKDHLLNSRIHKDSVSLDHFKHAALLCYWLVKERPILEVVPKTLRRYLPEESVSKARLRSLWKEFENFSDEIVAFLFGFNLCNAYQLQKVAKEIIQDRANVIKLKVSLEQQLNLQRHYELNPILLHDTVRILHSDNLSVYSLYLYYRAIFEQGPKPPHEFFQSAR
jgi:hypothetical protein